MSLAKVGLAGLATAAGATGTYLLVWGSDAMPESTTINELNNYQTTYNNNIGSQYAYFLVASSETKNREWWKWVHRRWKVDVESEESQPASDEFKKEKIGEAFDVSVSAQASSSPTPPKKALNKVCEDVYKKQKTDVSIEDTDTKKKNLMQDLWKYCSFLGSRPETIKEAKQPATASTIGKTKEGELISTTADKNDKFWEIKGKWFKSLTISDANDYFKKNVGSETGKKSLKQVCEDAYGKSTTSGTEGTEPKQDEVIKYCSLDTLKTASASK